MNNWFKKNGIHLGIIAIFVVICFVYFAPAFSGKVLFQSDVQQAQAGQTEIMKYRALDGKAPLWTNSMFGGMPSYQIWTQYPNNITTYILTALKWALPNPADTVLLYLLGAYLLFSVLRLNPWLAALGAIAFAFSSYNFIIIDAGHTNKAVAIAFFAPIVAGIILTFRGKYWWGAFLTALFLALEIRSNHIQMTYYLFLALIILAGFELYEAIKNKTLPAFAKSIAYLLAGVTLAVALNASMLWTTYEYGQLSNRGKSNLTSDAAQPSNGLDKEYAYGWSQGIGECITFLIPNAYGGASGPMLDEKSEVAKVLVAKGADATQATGFAQQMPVYWGEKQFTSGPWYFGAFLVFLFIFGLFVVKGKLKWWLLSATVLSILLSFGKNFDLVSNIFFNYFPLYNKFRAVESTLVIAGLCVPILACLAICEATKTVTDTKAIIKNLKISAYIVLGLILVMLLLPTMFFTFKTLGHQEFIGMLKQGLGGDDSFANTVGNALIMDRTSLFKADAIRSLIIIVLGIGILWAAITQKLSKNIAYVLMAVLVLGDMWSVDKRYLNDKKFMVKSEVEQQKQPREIDAFIQQDKDPNFRVLDLTGSPFSSAEASNFHKSIGGYHAAKLKRFNEVIDKQLSTGINQDVLDMLNTKYFITQGKEEGQSASMQRNNTACGNAWFVSSVKFAKDNNEEMQAISSFDPLKEAIVHKEFEKEISPSTGVPLNGMIKLTAYHPDKLKYEYSLDKDAVAVFSEIWYPKGWNMYVDGSAKSYFRANYLLRAAELPAGNHTIEWKFEPKSYYLGEKISLCASIVLFLTFCLLIYYQVKDKK